MVWRRKRTTTDKTGGDQKLAGSPVVVPNGSAEGAAVTSPESAVGIDVAATGKGVDGLTPRNGDQVADYSVAPQTFFEPLPAPGSATRSYCVPRSYRITADISSSRPVTVLGELEGRELVANITTVLPGGVLKGSARVGVLRVAGVVEADVEAKINVDVASQGEIRGRIATPSMRVAPGAKMLDASLLIGND